MLDCDRMCVNELSLEDMAETSGGQIHLWLPAASIASFFASLFG